LLLVTIVLKQDQTVAALWLSEATQFCLFSGHLVHFVAIWYILWSFGIHISSIMVFCTKKNLATLGHFRAKEE
jgi:hypothetical protein